MAFVVSVNQRTELGTVSWTAPRQLCLTCAHVNLAHLLSAFMSVGVDQIAMYIYVTALLDL
jgi:hypothetical protein